MNKGFICLFGLHMLTQVQMINKYKADIVYRWVGLNYSANHLAYLLVPDTRTIKKKHCT